jgi:hypothetical protein
MECRKLAGELSPTPLVRLSGDSCAVRWSLLPDATSSPSPSMPSPKVGRAPEGCEDAMPEKKVRRLLLLEVLNRRPAEEISSRNGGW